MNGDFARAVVDRDIKRVGCFLFSVTGLVTCLAAAILYNAIFK